MPSCPQFQWMPGQDAYLQPVPGTVGRPGAVHAPQPAVAHSANYGAGPAGKSCRHPLQGMTTCIVRVKLQALLFGVQAWACRKQAGTLRHM